METAISMSLVATHFLLPLKQTATTKKKIAQTDNQNKLNRPAAQPSQRGSPKQLKKAGISQCSDYPKNMIGFPRQIFLMKGIMSRIKALIPWRTTPASVYIATQSRSPWVIRCPPWHPAQIAQQRGATHSTKIPLHLAKFNFKNDQHCTANTIPNQGVSCARF